MKRCRFASRLCCALVALLLLSATTRVRAEAMLQLFNVNYDELIAKMPEIAEAGYTSLWLPPPSKGGSVFSVGYDLFDPFDLGDKDQRGTVRTRYGTKAQLLRAVEVAHRFGLRVYFDNIMNHRGFEVPGYNEFVPTNIYPGMVPGDFHIQRISGGFYRNWNNIGNWNSTFEIQNNPLSGLIDIAQESPNINHGFNYRDQAPSPVLVRHPNNPEYYMDTDLPAIGGGLRPFNGTNGNPVPENTGAYVIRSALWLLNELKADGFRLDAVKHTPGYFFSDYNNASANGYLGALQVMYDWVHGYGNNVTGNGYVEGDDNRNSNYDSETPRNDALLFGEHLGEPPSYDDYFSRGMRLLDNPLRNNLNDVLGNPSASLAGYEQRDVGGFSAGVRVMHASSHDNSFAARRELQNAYYFFREGIPLIYSDGYNEERACDGCDPFPRIAHSPYLGQFGDNKMPDLAWLHGQLARGGTRPRWGDADVIAFERFDYREGGSAADQTVVLFAMNDNYGNPGDISFDDGVANATGGTFYECFPVVNSRGQGMVVGFPPGSVLVQMADAPGDSRACSKLLVRLATNSKSDAENSKNDPNPVNRKVYVGSQGLAPGGGAIEFKVPSGGYVAYAYEGPQPSKASQRDVITFRHNNVEVPRMTVRRVDGRDGDTGFNPKYPFKMRGSIDQFGNVVRGSNVAPRTYEIDVPIVTNAPFDILVRPDASANNVLVKLDGGIDLNSQMGMGSTNPNDKRDNKPGSATDVFLGYEQAQFRYRRSPEKFGSTNVANNTVVSVGAETFRYVVGGSSSVMVGSGGGASVDTETADWVFHNPARPVTGGNNPPATQRVPLGPGANQATEIWIKVGYKFDINEAHIYYTTDGSNPEGSFASGRDTTRVVAMSFDHTEGEPGGTVDWWRGTIPAQPGGTIVKYKVAVYDDGINPISDANEAKRWGVTQFAITGFDPANALVWLHNNRKTNDTRVGLEEGFHIVRARAFLPRSGKSSVFNTYAQTFYFDAQPPEGAIAFPRATDTLRSQQYGVVVRADATVTEVEYNILDSSPANDDATTGLNNGNGTNAWARATLVNPSGSISAQFPQLPQEFRFNYYAVPASGTATITVRFKEVTSAVLTNRLRVLSRTVPTQAPAQTLEIAFPGSDGQTLSLGSGEAYTIVARFSEVLTANMTNFTIRIDDVVQPRFNGTNALYYFQDQTGGDGKNELRYAWTNIVPGQHIIEVQFNGDGLALEAARFVNVNVSGAAVTIVQPPAADSQGRSPYQIVFPSDNGPPLVDHFVITAETTTQATNLFIRFSTNAFAGGAATRDTNFTGNAARWNFAWSNLTEGTFALRADALTPQGTNAATRVVQVIFAPVDQFKLLAPARSGDTFSFGIQTLEGRTYVIEYADDLANPSWQTLPNVVGDGTLKVVNNTAPGVAQRFFRFRTL